MALFKAIWYNVSTVVKEDDELIEAETMEEGTKKAYQRYSGNPPAPLLLLTPVGST